MAALVVGAGFKPAPTGTAWAFSFTTDAARHVPTPDVARNIPTLFLDVCDTSLLFNKMSFSVIFLLYLFIYFFMKKIN
jgi:hypothetical protein